MKHTLDKGTILPDSDGETRRYPGWRLAHAIRIEVVPMKGAYSFKATVPDTQIEGYGVNTVLAIDNLLPELVVAAEESRATKSSAAMRDFVEVNSPMTLKAGTPLPCADTSREMHRLAVDVTIELIYSGLLKRWFAHPETDGPAEMMSGSGEVAAEAVRDLLALWNTMLIAGVNACWPQIEEYYWVVSVTERIEVSK